MTFLHLKHHQFHPNFVAEWNSYNLLDPKTLEILNIGGNHLAIGQN
jgi:hypothetical protein